jgi:hypothetical protein
VITSNEAVLTAADCARIEAETRLLVANSDRDLAVNQKSSDTPRDGTLPTNAILKAVDMRALTTLALELETSTKMAIDVNQDHRQLDFEKATTRATSSHYSVVELADQVMF